MADVCGAQLSQEHNGEILPVAFLSTPLWKLNVNGASQIGSLWGLLCHNQVGLLPPRFRYNHV